MLLLGAIRRVNCCGSSTEKLFFEIDICVEMGVLLRVKLIVLGDNDNAEFNSSDNAKASLKNHSDKTVGAVLVGTEVAFC